MTAPRANAAKCGTPSGYNRHLRLGEMPCNACAKAQNEYFVRNRNASDDNVRKSRLCARAQGRATVDLRRAHREEYRRLYLAYKAVLFAEAGFETTDATS